MKYVLSILAVMLAVGFTATQAETPEVTVRVEKAGGGITSHLKPDVVVTTEWGTSHLFNNKAFFAEAGVIRVYLDGERILDHPEIDGDGKDNQLGYYYNIKVTLGLGAPEVEATRTVRLFDWGPLGWGPLRDQRGGGYVQQPHLLGCNRLLKQCTIDPVTNVESCPLVCIEEGWPGPQPIVE